MVHELSINVQVRNKMIVRFMSHLIFSLLFILSGCEKDEEPSSAKRDYKNKGNNTFLKQESLWEKGKLFSVDGEKLSLIKVLLPWNTKEEIHRAKEYYENVFPYVTALALSHNGKYLAWGDWSENVFIWDQKYDNIITVNDSTISRPKIEKQERAREDFKRLNDYYVKYIQEHGREPSEEEFMRSFDKIGFKFSSSFADIFKFG